jgi:hypothetical protein
LMRIDQRRLGGGEGRLRRVGSRLVGFRLVRRPERLNGGAAGRTLPLCNLAMNSPDGQVDLA